MSKREPDFFVDDVKDYGDKGLWCHLWTSGTVDDLDHFAVLLNLNMRWRHRSEGVGIVFEHYDLRPSKRRVDRKAQESPIFPKAVEFQVAVNTKYQRIRSNHPKASSFVAIHKDGIPLESVPLQKSLWDTYRDTDDGCGEVCGL